MKSLFRILLAPCISMSLAGCFEATEDIVIRKDGTALVEFEVTFTGSMALIAGSLDESMRDPFGDASGVIGDLKAQPGVSKAKYGESKKGSSRVHRLTVELDDYRGLPQVSEILMRYQRDAVVESTFMVQSVGPTQGRVTQRLVGRNVEISVPTHLQGMPVAPMVQGKKGEAREYLAGRLRDRYIFVTLRAPSIGDHNGKLDESGSVVSWDVPLSALVGSPGRAYDLAADVSLVGNERPLWKRLIFFWK
ncbi:MAG: hypothetical protein AAGD22_07290 [Verrucomicrobiota bacterium]